MTRRASFKPNNRGIGRVLSSQRMEREMASRGRVILGYAQSQAPHRTGNYAKSFQVESGQENSPIRLGQGDRAWALVRNTSPNAAAVEFGNKRVGEGRRVLGRAADRVSQ